MPCNRRCPNCGRIFNRPGRPGGGEGSCPAPSLAQELYAGVSPEPRREECCDPRCGCRTFDSSCRDPYWPSFCHPRWLSCRHLYRGRR